MTGIKDQEMSLEAKAREIRTKKKKLSEMKNSYFEEGFTATKERQRYLALKIMEIEHEIKANRLLLKNISTELEGLNRIEGSISQQERKQSTLPVHREPVSQKDMDKLYRKWESTKKKKETKKPLPSKHVKQSSKAAFSFYSGDRKACITASERFASIRSLITDQVLDTVEGYNPLLSYADNSSSPENNPTILNPFSTASMNDLDVSVKYVKNVNMALIHNDKPIIDKLSITNTSTEEIANLMAGIWVSPDYSDSFETSIPVITSGSSKELDEITPPFSSGRLKQIFETEKGLLRLELSDGSKKIFTESYPIRIMPYNEWYIGPEYKFAETIASFVFPNDLPDSPAVETVLSHAVNRLETLTGTTSFDGYQSGDPKKVIGQARAIFDSIQQDIGLTYINPPASFEFTGQRVLSPRQIMEHRRGTCLDTTVFYASCLERIGLHPVIFLVQGHAFVGFWLLENFGLIYDADRSSKTSDYDIVRTAVENMYLVPVESTLLTRKEYSFDHAVNAWLDPSDEKFLNFRLEKERFHSLVDVYGSRINGVKPMPI